MVITWYGYNCFRIQQEQGRDLEVSLITDPFTPEKGERLPRNFTSDIVTVSHDHSRHNNLAAVEGSPFVIDGPGEYEVKELFVTGVATYHDMVEGKEKGQNTMFYITGGDMHLVHLGDLKHPLEEKHLEEFHHIDVLFVPVGGGTVLDAKQAAAVVDQLDPRVVVPMHYRAGNVGAASDTVDAFLKAIGAPKSELLPKLKLAKKDLPQEERIVALLDPQ
jgi:L-ascorbate metabolism protein UlaG (beta-lactamase superfamily)